MTNRGKPPTSKTFGEAFGELIRKKRGQEGLTQRELAIRAFDDESKVRRIIDLENGTVNRPQAKTVDPLVVFFDLKQDELEGCRQHGLFSPEEQGRIGLPRELIENLALRFEHDNPDASDEDLIAFLKEKATELKNLKRRLSELEGTTHRLTNQINAANEALEYGRFGEADEILANAEEVQQEERTLKEIEIQSEIRLARGDAALFANQSNVAAAHYLKAAEYFSGFDHDRVAELLSESAGKIYEYERRTRIPDLTAAVDLAQRAVALTGDLDGVTTWVRRKYRLALLQLTEARSGKREAWALLNAAIDSLEEVLKRAHADVSDFDIASCRVALGNAYLQRGERLDNPKGMDDLTAALSVFEKAGQDSGVERLLHRCHIYNNISTTYRAMSARQGEDATGPLAAKAKKALLRAIELSAEGDQMDVWAAAQYNW